MSDETTKQAKQAERAAKRADKANAAKQEQARREAEFEANKELIWLRLWSRALQLKALQIKEEFVDLKNSWWFEDFVVELTPGKESVSIQMGGNRLVSFATFGINDADQLKGYIDDGFNLRLDVFERREAEALERARIEKIRTEAISKLNDEEIKVLGIR